MNTFSLLLNAGFSSSEDTAVVFENTRLTYEALKNRVYYISEALVRLGAGKGTHVGFADHNCCELAEVFFAVSKFGGTMVPLNFREDSETLLSLIDLGGVEILITSGAFAEVVRQNKRRLPSLKAVIARESPSGLDYRRLLAKRERSDFIADMNGDEANVLVFQRDEMGYMSAYAVSYERILRTTEYLVFRRDASPDMRASLFCEPLYQIQSMPTIASAVYSGRKLVIMREFEPRQWAELVSRERITNTVLLPASLSTLLDNMPTEKEKLKSLEYIKLGVAAMPVELVRRASELLPDHIKFVNEYRPKKTAGIVACFISDAHILEGTDEEVAAKLRHLNSIGKAGAQSSEIEIVDGAMNKVPAGAVGRIMVKEAGSSEWIDTGDLGWLDEEGYIYLAGNKTSVSVENPQHTRMDVAVMPAYYDRRAPAAVGDAIPGDTTPVPDMDDVFDFLRRVYESMEPDRIVRNYLDCAESIVSVDAYGINFGPGKQLLTDYLDAQVSILSPFIGEPTEESVWMREKGGGWSMIPLRAYLRGEQAQIARIPMLSSRGTILGTLSYVRMGEREFSGGELARMRWVGSHMCVVVDNSCKYEAAVQNYEVAMSALNVIKSAVVISESGRVTFINRCAKEIFDSASGLYENGRELWDRLRSDAAAFRACGGSTLESTVRLKSADGDALVQLHTCRSGSGDSLITLLYSNINSSPRTHSFAQVLSTREQEVLELITRGLKNQDIARELMISGNTVKFHIKQIYSKLSVGDRVELFNKTNIN